VVVGIHELFEANADADPKHTAIVGPSHDKADEQVRHLYTHSNNLHITSDGRLKKKLQA
jgi:hypothetical protein